jgi:hypothetical protein
MALNYKQKKKMKSYLVIAGVIVAVYYLVFKTLFGKNAVNGAALKMGIGTTAKPLIP